MNCKSVQHFCVLVIIFVFFIQRISECEARKNKPPLIEEKQTRFRLRPTHCAFGNQTYEIEERWRPQLQPFGVYYCIRCECIAVQRKNRIVAKVRCQNFKNDCPKPTCDEPVLLPERCCKTCPGKDYADIEEDLAVRKLESNDEDLIKEYSVQMNGRGLKPNVATDMVARGFLYFQKRHLHYTILISGTENPTYVRFTDKEGVILKEQEIEKYTKTANSSKVLGVWRNVPKVYKAMLRKGKLHLALAIEKSSEAISIIAGKIVKNDLSQPEVFRELLNLDLLNFKSTDDVVDVNNVREDKNQVEKKFINDQVSQDNQINRNHIIEDTLETNVSKTNSCYFEGDKKYHLAGSRWQPYIYPFGFSKCAFCTCLAESLVIHCEKSVKCSALTCPDHEAYRENPMDCCKRCPNAVPVKSIVTVDQLGDQRSVIPFSKSPNELMAAGGCRLRGRIYPNGDEWHPTVQPFGEVKCVKCNCKDGNLNCKRIVCPKLQNCNIVIKKNNECCPICADDSEDSMMKNQPEVVNTRKRGNNRRRNKGRRAVHEKQT